MANEQDANFVKELSAGNTAEITEGNLAIQKSPQLAVSEFGRWMVTDHTALGSIFAKVAEKAGYSVSTEPNEDQQAEINKLSNLSGKDFDKAYVKEQVTDHQQTLALLKQEVSNGEDQSLVSFAKQSLPIIKAHLEQAQILDSDLIPGSSSTKTQANNQNSSSGSSSESQYSSASYSMAMNHESQGQSTIAVSQGNQSSWTS
jgi:putative membrane protein